MTVNDFFKYFSMLIKTVIIFNAIRFEYGKAIYLIVRGLFQLKQPHFA